MWGVHGVEGSKRKARTRERALANCIRVDACDVYFTQDAGFATFSDGRPVAQTIREIVTGALAPQSLPLLRCVREPGGRLYSLDNRRLFCFRACGVRGLDVELIDNKDGANQEMWCKRYGINNGTTTGGEVLRIKPDGTSKKALAMAAALLPCTACGCGAVARLRAARFEKGAKFATLPSGCCVCASLVKLLKREKPAGGAASGAKGAKVARAAGGKLTSDELAQQLAAIMQQGGAGKAKLKPQSMAEPSGQCLSGKMPSLTPPLPRMPAEKLFSPSVATVVTSYGNAFDAGARARIAALLAPDIELTTPRGASRSADAALGVLLMSRARMAPTLRVGVPVVVSADSAEVTFSFENKQGATVVLVDLVTVQHKLILSIVRRKINAE